MRSMKLIQSTVAIAAVTVAVALPPSSADAQVQKVLRASMSTDGPKTLDPVRGSTTYDNRCCSQLYQTLLQYKYLVRPEELEPLLLAEMPEISEDGLIWRFTLKRGILFHDDECFPGGKGRELVARDVFYSWKRLADPEYRYKNFWLFKGTIVGFDEYKDAQAARVDAGEEFDYDASIEGFRIINDFEFEVTLKRAVRQFQWKLAMFQTAIVPREAVEFHGDRFNRHPVGTGPFVMRDERDWELGKSLVLYRNPNYMADYYPNEWMPEDEAAGLTSAVGTRLPIADKLEIDFFVEANPQWLEFRAGNKDFTTVPETGFEDSFNKRTKELKRSWRNKGIRHVKLPLLDFIFRGFNMEDPLVGGYGPKKKALRQAISLCMDWDELNEDLYWGTTQIYDGPIPPSLDGYPEGGHAPINYRGPDYERAREKLREAGYTVVDGKVIDLPRIEFYTSRGATSEKIVQQLERNLAEVGIKIKSNLVDFSTLIEAVDNKKAPFFSFAWGSDYPDAENNLALFYSPNVSPGSNHYNYSRPEYDEMYERCITMPPGPERTALYIEMRDMVIEDTPFVGSLGRTRYYVIHPWLKNFKPTETFYNYFKYLDVDMNDPKRPR